MNIQIFGSKKSRLTQKAVRFFKERRIKFQEIDVFEKGLSRGEWESVKKAVGLENLLDRESRSFVKRQLAYQVIDLDSELTADPGLLKLPIVRNGGKAAAGDAESVWLEWIRAEQNGL